MLLGLILMSLFGMIFIYFGLMIWKKEKITLIHSYHYSKVKEQDKKPYTELVGKGVLTMGIGMMLTGIINYITETGYGWLVFGAFFIAGFVIVGIAQKRYNGGFF